MDDADADVDDDDETFSPLIFLPFVSGASTKNKKTSSLPLSLSLSQKSAFSFLASKIRF